MIMAQVFWLLMITIFANVIVVQCRVKRSIDYHIPHSNENSPLQTTRQNVFLNDGDESPVEHNDNLFPDNNVDNKVVLENGEIAYRIQDPDNYDMLNNNNILSQTNDVNTELSRPHESNDNNNS
ncbi:hypothetical protein KSF78_0006760 [Schistosoma japonicum]|nr:hypothetical protein KSF78_0006760 [Schistosoma japonicum]KAH8858981.1 hypothetical protein KSF78_0006760 [Schistosoma japonicum]